MKMSGEVMFNKNDEKSESDCKPLLIAHELKRSVERGSTTKQKTTYTKNVLEV